MSEPSFQVGIDIGGTFTDLILVNVATGEFTVGKILTSTGDPSEAVEEVLRDAVSRADVSPSEISTIVHGTTLVTNAVIERKGARTALLTTQGFRDSIEIGRENRYELYDLMLDQPRPLVPRHLRFDVPQRTLADGSTLQEVDKEYVARLAREFVDAGISAVAICFLHSFTNPDAERATRRIIHDFAPTVRVSISSDVVAELREFERASTTVVNVYVQARVEAYVRELQTRLARVGFAGHFFMMLSSGGIATPDTAVRFPVRLLESGPAAGALAAAAYGRAVGMTSLLSFDMGGTTAKLCVIDDGRPLIAHDFEVDRIYRFKKGSGLPVKVPVIEMIEIGTGGGSIARVDAMGLLKVGPESSGSLPGPVCYKRGGTQPTVTDADLVLGYLAPGYFLGGRMSLDLDAAREAIQSHIADKMRVSVIQAAWGIHQIANENMANAARVHALERGKDPSRLPLFAFGGAGPVHAFRIAKALGSPRMLAPYGAGVMSTVGFLSAPIAFDFVRSWRAQLQSMDWHHVNSLLGQLESEGMAVLVQSGVDSAAIVHDRQADMRFVGQGHEIRVPLPSGSLSAETRTVMEAEFQRVYRQLYERPGPPVAIEVINWRVTSRGPDPILSLQMPAMTGTNDGSALSALKGTRAAYFPETGDYGITAVYDRYLLFPGATFIGPAIVEERESTVIVGPGATCTIDGRHNLIVQIH